MRRWLGLPVLLAALAVATTGCDPIDVAAPPSSWTPRPAPTVWPSIRDLTHYLPTEADGSAFGVGLTRAGPLVSEPPAALLRVCDLPQPWDALVRYGAALTWQADGQEIRQVIIAYGRISAREVLDAIRAALDSCGSFTYEGTRYHRTSTVGISAADATEAHEVFCTDRAPKAPPEHCFALLASHDRLTQLAIPGGGKDIPAELNALTKVISPFAIAVART
ncbi:hypothetical protein [Amycolatopsis sp. WQ 127309]|uniref:hypothetical protein n=1 Tax=Amycolatopsis sp. WQ 127309 TaxID=2932773 RepID=UPI001FF636AD|nr:hypothetical protein [Amycolatopsis sp. WQ 127309]UOZ08321.1 hypothetical protein MUY22_08605 [Amycolatopsis sp. WQ 127309]